MFTYVCWYLLFVDDGVCLRGRRGYSAIFSNHSLVLTEVLETAVVVRGQDSTGRQSSLGEAGVRWEELKLGKWTIELTVRSLVFQLSSLSLSPTLSPSLPWTQRPSWLDQRPHPRSKSDGDVWEVTLQKGPKQ